MPSEFERTERLVKKTQVVMYAFLASGQVAVIKVEAILTSSLLLAFSALVQLARSIILPSNFDNF